MVVTRFAPSPNGMLHLGHAYSAITSHDLAKERGGQFLLRIEDIDGARSRPELGDEFRRDLEWLGLEWEEVPAQSTRLESYRAATDRLLDLGVLTFDPRAVLQLKAAHDCQCYTTISAS